MAVHAGSVVELVARRGAGGAGDDSRAEARCAVVDVSDRDRACDRPHAAQDTGIPWVADFRDPMAQDGYPAEPALHRAFERIERKTSRIARVRCSHPRRIALYAERYPDLPPERLGVIENGYDEAAFAGGQQRPPGATGGRASAKRTAGARAQRNGLRVGARPAPVLRRAWRIEAERPHRAADR
jgi:hypothetical protein